jgi:hypothetical protein
MARKRKTVGTKATDKLEKMLSDPDTKDALDKMLICGLKLKLETAWRKNPYFKGRRKPEHMKLPQEYKRAAMRFARGVVEAYFLVARVDTSIVSPN